MKAVIKENERVKQEKKYPCLMIHPDGTVVLFNGENSGMTLVSGGGATVGHVSNSYYMAKFTPFTGTIELSND